MTEIFIAPYILKSTQFTACPSNDYVRPYSMERDPGIKVGKDERGQLWIVDGHNRVGSAIERGVSVKVGEFIEVRELDMLLLAEG